MEHIQDIVTRKGVRGLYSGIIFEYYKVSERACDVPRLFFAILLLLFCCVDFLSVCEYIRCSQFAQYDYF